MKTFLTKGTLEEILDKYLVAYWDSQDDIEEDLGHEAWDDYIDEFSKVEILGQTYYAPNVLKDIDPTAYETGLADYNDSLMSEQYLEIMTGDDQWIYIESDNEDFVEELIIKTEAEEEEEDDE